MSAPDIRLSVAVMTHPQRLHMAERLRAEHPDLDIRIVADTSHAGAPGSLRSARRAWAAVDPDATHHLVVQDDVRLPADLHGRLRPFIASRPDGALSLFAEWGAWTSAVVRLAALTGAAWAEAVDTYVPTQAMVLPAALARAADGYLAAALDRSEPDDVALLGYLRQQGVVPHVCVPNLVEHLDAPSTTGNDDFGLRRSVCWLPGTGGPPAALRRAVTGVDAVPYVAWWDGFAVYWVRDPAERTGWRKEHAVPALAKLGLTRAFLKERCRAAVDDADGPALRELVSEILMFHVWLGSFCLGLRAADIAATPAAGGPGTRTESALDMSGPVAERALATLAPGALRRFIPVPQLDLVGRLLEPVVRAGVALGAEVLASGGVDTGLLPSGLVRV
jgi:hypothetical protein